MTREIEFYGDEADEFLSYDDPEEYVASRIESFSAIDDEDCIVVCAFVRKTVPPKVAKSWADRLTDNLADMFGDDGYGDPEHGNDFKDAWPHFVRAFSADIQRVIREHVCVWACEIVDRHTYGAEELRRIAKEYEL